MDKYPDAALLYYDSEFGTPLSYWDSFGIDMDRVLHSPVTNLEELTFDLVGQLTKLERGEHVIVVLDSLGNVPSKKELDDTLNEKSSVDMTRAKAVKALFRQAAIQLNTKDIPMLVISHTYKTLELYSKDVVSGGTGQYYNADNIFILGRQQDADKVDGKKEIQGYHFIINVEKSRYVREKSKIPITVSFDTGIEKYSGMFDLAVESGHIVPAINPKTGKSAQGKYNRVGDTVPYSVDEMDKKFWDPILKDPKFSQFIKDKYCLTSNAIMSDNEVTIYDDKIKEAIHGKTTH